MIEDAVIDCPYCGESFGTLIDGSGALDGEQTADYIEDCAVCCRPIRFVVAFDASGAVIGLDLHTDSD